MNPNDVGIGSIIIGLLIVMALAAAVYMLGIWIVSRFRTGRVNEETDITYPANPQGADDRRAVQQVQGREGVVNSVGSDNATDVQLHQRAADNATDEVLRERAVGAGMRPVRQSPTRNERPVDADHDRGVAPREGSDAPTSGRSDRNPL